MHHAKPQSPQRKRGGSFGQDAEDLQDGRERGAGSFTGSHEDTKAEEGGRRAGGGSATSGTSAFPSATLERGEGRLAGREGRVHHAKPQSPQRKRGGSFGQDAEDLQDGRGRGMSRKLRRHEGRRREGEGREECITKPQSPQRKRGGSFGQDAEDLQDGRGSGEFHRKCNFQDKCVSVARATRASLRADRSGQVISAPLDSQVQLGNEGTRGNEGRARRRGEGEECLVVSSWVAR